MQTKLRNSGAFREVFELPPTREGQLSGLTFAAKDLIDIKGYRNSFGNPTWLKTHLPAKSHAVCIEQLLAAGAQCVGKTHLDELAFSLNGENDHYGTPNNPKAPESIPGGSSSGSASAVAQELVDFSLGSDTGGSIRIPAHNCGIFGMRPSHGRISVAGVCGFAPTFDTIGVFAQKPEILSTAMKVLLGIQASNSPKPKNYFLLKETFEMAGKETIDLIQPTILSLKKRLEGKIQDIPLNEVDKTTSNPSLHDWRETFSTIQWAEIWNSLGTWMEETKPELGPRIKANFELAKGLDRKKLQAAIIKREQLAKSINDFLANDSLLIMPTGPYTAPKKGSLGNDRTRGSYYPATLAFTSIAGIGRLPQLTLPIVKEGSPPIGLSILAGYGRDELVLNHPISHS